MKKLVAACLPLVLIVVFMIVGVSVGESESLAGMAAGSHTATASTRQGTCSVLIEDNLPSPDGVGVISWTDENKKNAAMLARLMLGDVQAWKDDGSNEVHLHGVHLNLVQIAGILGNFYQESGWITNKHQGGVRKNTLNEVEGDDAHIHNGEGIGIAQWTFWNRKQNLIDYAKQAPGNWYDPSIQVGFLLKEISEGYAGDLQSKTSVADATATFLKNFENPGNTFESEYNKRLPYAKDTYAYLLKLNLRIPTDDDSSKMNECKHELGSVEGGSLADFKYNGKITGNATPITNVKDFEKYGWNDNGTFDAKMLPSSDGQWEYFREGRYQCTTWVAVRMLSLGLTKRLMDAGITWHTLNYLGMGKDQAGTLHAAGVPMDRKPQVHDVVSYTNMNHVAFVEEVHGNTIIISEGNSYDAYDGSSSAVDLKSTSTENMVFAHVEEFLKSKGK